MPLFDLSPDEEALVFAACGVSTSSSTGCPSNLLARDAQFDHVLDLRSVLTGFAARPGTVR